MAITVKSSIPVAINHPSDGRMAQRLETHVARRNAGSLQRTPEGMRHARRSFRSWLAPVRIRPVARHCGQMRCGTRASGENASIYANSSSRQTHGGSSLPAHAAEVLASAAWLARMVLFTPVVTSSSMRGTRLEVTALLDKSERIRKKAAELHGQLQALIASVERFLDRKRSAQDTFEPRWRVLSRGTR